MLIALCALCPVSFSLKSRFIRPAHEKWRAETPDWEKEKKRRTVLVSEKAFR